MNRRYFLNGAAGAALATAAPLSVDAAAPSPDAALIRAFDDWLQAIRDFDAFDPNCERSSVEHEPFMGRMTDAQERIVALPALTLQGAAIKARWAWAKLSESREVEDALAYGKPLSLIDLGDWRLQALQGVIGDLERMTRAEV